VGVSIAYGNFLDPPSSPVSVGRVTSATQLVPGSLPTDPPDATTDCVVGSVDELGHYGVSVLVGQTDRVVLAPFGLTDPLSNKQGIPLRLGMGHFASHAEDHYDIAAFAFDVQRVGVGVTVGSDNPFSLWLAPGSGDASFTYSTHTDFTPQLTTDPLHA